MPHPPRELPGIDPDKWRDRSRAGQVCGIVGCPNPPARRCKTCRKHYCQVHAEPHAKGGHGTVSVLEGEGGLEVLAFTRSQGQFLCRAAAWEKKHPGESWTWRDVDAELGDTTKLLVLGFVDIVGEEDPAGHLLYLLTPAGREQGK